MKTCNEMRELLRTSTYFMLKRESKFGILSQFSLIFIVSCFEIFDVKRLCLINHKNFEQFFKTKCKT